LTEINLYVEVTPITMGIKVRKGNRLNQLRLFNGSPKFSQLNADILEYYGSLLYPLNKYPKDYLSVDLTQTAISNTEMASAFMAKEWDNSKEYIDISKPESYEPKDFWEPIPWDPDDKTLKIEPNKFYIIRSKERLNLPHDVGVYGQAMTESLGEMRIHYAGFAHPFFGYGREYRDSTGLMKRGTPLIFEIRGHNVAALLRDGEKIARLKFSRMSGDVAQKEVSYLEQELTLSKYFRNWSKNGNT